MRILVRAFGAMALLLALCATPMSASANPTSMTARHGFSKIAGCISGAKNLLVSVVVDESLSLRQTDPHALRVQGITTAVDSLEQLTSTVGASTSVEVSMSTFARGYHSLVPWRKLNAQTAQQLRTTAARKLPARDAGDATDYRQALLGAKRQLDTRQHQLKDPNACKLLLWFTDGALDVDAQTNLAATELCQVGGIADAVREDGIAVVALALFTPGAGVTQPQREQLRAVAEGRGSGTSCGRTPIPPDSASGVYLPADDPAALQRLFAGAGALVAGGSEVGTISCPGPHCPGGVYRLDVDPGVAGARVLVQSAGTPNVAVTSPSGQRIDLTSGQHQRVDGASVSYLVRDRLATVNINFDPYTDSRSRWTIRTAGRSELGVYWFWGAHLALTTTEVKAGADNDIALRLQDQNGAALPARYYRHAHAILRVGSRKIRARLTPDGILHGPLHLGVDDLPAKMPVTASLVMRSSPNNVLLGPISLSKPIPVTLPPTYPTVFPKELDFGHLEGIGTTSAKLRFIGSRLGSTKVCVVGSTVMVPGQKPSRGLVKASQDCVSLGPDQSKSLSLHLSPRTTADGVSTGQVRLRMTAADGSRDLKLTVPTRLEMQRHVDEETRWALIGALLGLAALVPALLLVGSNLLLARFLMTSTSRTCAKPVKITSSGLRPLGGTELLEPEEFDNAPFSGTRKGRRMSIDGTGIRLKARRIFSLKQPEGVASGPLGQMLVSSILPYRGESLNEAPAALGEVDATFVIINPDGATPTEANGTLVMVVPDGVGRQGIHDRASQMSSAPEWERYLAHLAEETRHSEVDRVATPARTEPPAWGSSDGPTSTSTSADTVPDLPWGWANDETSVAPAPEPKKPRFGRSAKPRRSAPSTPPPSSGEEQDDDLPPLPDFLK